MIYQGQNSPLPIKISGDISAVQNMSVLLHNGVIGLKLWSYDDLNFSEDGIYAPMTETESMDFSTGMMKLEAKWLDPDGLIHIEPAVNIKVVERMDSTPLIADDDDGVTDGNDDGDNTGDDNNPDDDTSDEP